MACGLWAPAPGAAVSPGEVFSQGFVHRLSGRATVRLQSAPAGSLAASLWLLGPSGRQREQLDGASLNSALVCAWLVVMEHFGPSDFGEIVMAQLERHRGAHGSERSAARRRELAEACAAKDARLTFAKAFASLRISCELGSSSEVAAPGPRASATPMPPSPRITVPPLSMTGIAEWDSDEEDARKPAPSLTMEEIDTLSMEHLDAQCVAFLRSACGSSHCCTYLLVFLLSIGLFTVPWLVPAAAPSVALPLRISSVSFAPPPLLPPAAPPGAPPPRGPELLTSPRLPSLISDDAELAMLDRSLPVPLIPSPSPSPSPLPLSLPAR